MYYSFNVLLYYFTIVLLYFYTTVLLDYQTTVLLHWSGRLCTTIKIQYYCTEAAGYCITVLQYLLY